QPIDTCYVPHLLSSPRCRHPHPSPFFPYTTLFRSRMATARAPPPPSARGCPTLRCSISAWARSPTAALRSAATCARSPRRSVKRSEEHTSELQSLRHLVCRLLLEKKKQTKNNKYRV